MHQEDQSQEAKETKERLQKSTKFLLDLDSVNSVATCSKACYFNIGWLLNKAALESPVGCVKLEQQMPDGSFVEWAVEPTEDPNLVLPTEFQTR